MLGVDVEGTPVTGESDDASREERLLLARLRRGDPEAFEALVRAHQDRLYDFCVRMLGDREEANDLVQDIFVSAHQHLAKFREDSRLSTWLFRIGKNHCINRLKYLKRRGRGRSEEYGEQNEGALAELLGSSPGPDAALESAREQARVQWAISQLDPEPRMLVALRDIEGLSYEEIVDITELPLGTVKSRLHRAREKLADLLGRLEE
ncbi:sigma-70 family RNA polymerase sigma factor [Archangium minus]|uniref:Sigma-70 family RNA polymerase sigma factor n=1 Tax=Archangium minus TaxID=83450 RepID=A0ABY9XAT7_9BACT|nr:sigma-70 family RNA polymerase sigma factor [Archangium minus]